MSNFTVDDLVFAQDSARSVRSYIEAFRNESMYRGRVTTYGKGFTLGGVPHSIDFANTLEEATAYSKWLLKMYIHANHIVSNPGLFLPIANGESNTVIIRNNGVQTEWSLSTLPSINVKKSYIDRLLDGIAQPTQATRYMGYDNRFVYKFSENRLSDSFIGDVNRPLLARTMWLAKRQALVNFTASTNRVAVAHMEEYETNKSEFMMVVQGNGTESVDIATAHKVYESLSVLANAKVSRQALSDYRRAVLDIQSNELRSEENQRRQLAGQNFTKYWENLKSRTREAQPTVTQARAEWATIPLAEAGTESSRTWGIEIETVRADETSRPAGWRAEHDGSLPEDDECNCDCENCYEGDHDSDCTGCYNSSSKEFVSPVLRHFNSEGLRKLCADLGDYESSTAPGIHVHVGADDMTVTDVARLLFAYGVVAPLLQPLYHREVFGYCKEMSGRNIQWWLGAVKDRLRNTGRIPRPHDICYEQPEDRYQDVNLHALSKHGTIEFRAMGPYYNYDHLVRWAWFVREMVNVSKLGLDQRVWTACTSLTDVIRVLRKYGQEAPIDKAPLEGDTSDLVLANYEE